MFSPELLGETVIIGLLISLAVCLPFMLYPNPGRITHIFSRLDSLSSTGVAAVLLLVLVYSVGLVGSLLASDLSEETVAEMCNEDGDLNQFTRQAGLHDEVCGGFNEPDDQLKLWIPLDNERLQQLQATCKLTNVPAEQTLQCKMYNDWLGEGKSRGDFVKIAEMALKERDESVKVRLDREKAYVRISQGSALAFLLLILSTTAALFYRHFKDRYWPAAPRAEHALKTETLKSETVSTEVSEPGVTEPEAAGQDDRRALTLVWRRRLTVSLIALIYAVGVVGVIFCFGEYLDTETKYEELVVHLYGGLRPRPPEDRHP
jgi:hypothetical protein